MGEYAYDFTGENIHDGPSRNPHDVTRMTGGSSGGSGQARSAAAWYRWRWGRIPMARSGRRPSFLRSFRTEADLRAACPVRGRFRSSRASIILGPFARKCRRFLALGL